MNAFTATAQTAQTIVVPEWAREACEKKLGQLSRAIANHGGTCTVTWGEKHLYTHTNADGTTCKAWGYSVQVESDVLTANGYTALGKIEHTAEGNIITTFRTEGAETAMMGYRNAACTCEHCGTNRARKYTFVVRDDANGQLKQVGKACLNEYTGGISPEMAMLYYNDLAEVAEYGFASAPYPTVSTALYVGIAAAAIAKYGYVSRESAAYSTDMSTTDRVASIVRQGECTDWGERRIGRYMVAEASAQGIDINWETVEADGAALVSKFLETCTEESTFNQNMRVLVMADTLDCSKMARVAYLPVAVAKVEKKAQACAARDESNVSTEWYGQAGDKVDVEVHDWQFVRAFEGTYGFSFLYTFTDGQGHKFQWFKSSTEVDGTPSRIKGTVKELKEFTPRGCTLTEKVTALTRCKVA